MDLNDAEIENLLIGDMSDIEDFNDDEGDLNEEQIITQHIAEIIEFIDFNNVEMDNLEREQCLLDGEISLTQDLLNQSDNTEEADIKKENKEQLPANWVTGLLKARKDKINTRKSPLTPPTKKRYKRSNAPVPDVRFDGYQHWPELSENKKRCTFCVQPYSRTKCSKCNVALCFNSTRNCFKSYHEK